jgi:hypothetical protein
MVDPTFTRCAAPERQSRGGYGQRQKRTSVSLWKAERWWRPFGRNCCMLLPDMTLLVTALPLEYMFPKYAEICGPLLTELARRGGAARPREKDGAGLTIYESLAVHFALSEEARIATIEEKGGIVRSKWANMVRWARNDLRKAGLLENAEHGVWRLSASGHRRVQASVHHAYSDDLLDGTPVSHAEFQERLARAAEIGLAGERWVLSSERESLAASGCPDLSAQVRHTAMDDVGAGYDIASYRLEDGARIFIEVKTTSRARGEPFEFTRNELRTAERLGKAYVIVRLSEFSTEPGHIEHLWDPASLVCSGVLHLAPQTYRVTRGEVR